MISIDLSETASLCALEIRDKFFSNKIFFPDKFFFLGLNFCLRLNFVSDYIPQLYFVCNHLIMVYLQ